jgi:hypothetical protein
MTRITISAGFRPFLKPATQSRVSDQSHITSPPSAILRNKNHDEIAIYCADNGIFRVIYTPASINVAVPFTAAAATTAQERSIQAVSSSLVEYAVNTDNDAPRLSFFRKGQLESNTAAPFLRDSASRAYSFDSVSKTIFHYVR